MELRCLHKKHGNLIEPAADGVVEIKCDSRFCGARPGAVVLHQFSTLDGKLVKTLRFKDTPTIGNTQEEKDHAMGLSTAVRSA